MRLEFSMELDTQLLGQSATPGKADFRHIRSQQLLMNLILANPDVLARMLEARIIDCATSDLERVVQSQRLEIRKDEEILQPLIRQLDPESRQLFDQAISAGLFLESTQELCDCFSYALNSISLTVASESTAFRS